MAIRVGINGFGRIGRMVFRAAQNFDDVIVVGINDLLEPEYLAYLLKHDSVHGRFKGDIQVDGDKLIVNGISIRLSAERDPAELKWDAIDVDVVIESTGLFLTKEGAQKHIDAGAKKVIMSAPSKDTTPMFVFGVNHNKYAGEDIISNASGRPQRVIAVHPQGIKDIYRVSFVDGASLEVGLEHLWLAKIVSRKHKSKEKFFFGAAENNYRIYTTEQLIESVRKRNKSEAVIKPHIHIPLTNPVHFTMSYKSNPKTIHPYLLGVLIGDGSLTQTSVNSVQYTSLDEEIADYLIECGYMVEGRDKTWSVKDEGIKAKLSALQLDGSRANTKHIPKCYSHATLEERIELIKGLMDTDGYVDDRGHLSYTTVSKQLADDFQFIVRSLGAKATITDKIPTYTYRDEKLKGQKAYTVYFNTKINEQLVGLTRKAERIPEAGFNGGMSQLHNTIKDIEFIGKKEAQCITVDNPNGLYLADDFIVTHNSVLGCYWIFLRCIELINEFKIVPTKYPIPVGFMGRKRSVDFTDTTLETWKKFIPESAYLIRASEKEIIINERVKIAYGGFDSEMDIKKFNSAEFAFGFIDQAEETTQDDIALLRGALRLKIQEAELDYTLLLTANPADCWLKDSFVDTQREGYIYLPALPTDNPFLPKGYID
ncbi:MAG: hypothetical protein IIC09_00985, partial [Proteobacteria bacterium]|nr:hypothetical protein [Pseudomonadota bacterium]